MLAGLLTIMLEAGCVPVEGDRIEGRHLAAVHPLFAQMDPDTDVAHAPAPGVRRHFTAAGLRALAARHGVKIQEGTGLADACFEHPVKPLAEEEVKAALQAALPASGVSWELLDFSRAPLPRGELVFPVSGLGRAPVTALRSPVYWRGRLKYGGWRSFPVWAKLRAWKTGSQVVAAEALPAGKPVAAVQLRLGTGDQPVFSEPGVNRIDEVAGRVPRRSVRKGERVTARLLEAVLDVERGETVQVQVKEGGARLSFRAKAESGGRVGDRILVRNPENGRRFRARIETRGVVVVDGSEGNGNEESRNAAGVSGPGRSGG
jgi:flagella basal body P-ring formation protein FlgA